MAQASIILTSSKLIKHRAKLLDSLKYKKAWSRPPTRTPRPRAAGRGRAAPSFSAAELRGVAADERVSERASERASGRPRHCDFLNGESYIILKPRVWIKYDGQSDVKS